MEKPWKKHFNAAAQEEEKFLNQEEKEWISQKVNPLLDKVREKVPEKLKETLNLAFYKGFELVFEKGSKYIEKTYNKENLQFQHELNDYAVERKPNKKYFGRLDRQAQKAKVLNSAISAAEGSFLGVLGMGLPDIPLFLAVIIKNMYETALGYGFDYEKEEEKYYILLLICAALTKDERQKEFAKKLEEFETNSVSNLETAYSLKEQMRTTSDVLSDALLAAKFIQGFPVVGAVGGLVNLSIINKTGKFAGIKYKKRYLLSKLKKEETADAASE